MDTRVVSPPSENTETDRTRGKFAMQPVLAAYVQDGGSIKRTYLRPTEMRASGRRRRGAKTTSIFLDEITVTGTLVFRTATSAGIPAEGEEVKITLQQDFANKRNAATQTVTVRQLVWEVRCSGPAPGALLPLVGGY